MRAKEREFWQQFIIRLEEQHATQREFWQQFIIRLEEQHATQRAHWETERRELLNRIQRPDLPVPVSVPEGHKDAEPPKDYVAYQQLGQEVDPKEKWLIENMGKEVDIPKDVVEQFSGSSE